MSPENDNNGVAEEQAQPDIERGTYEIIRDRLNEQGSELGSKAKALNKKRLEIFGGTEMTVIGNERIRTENNCVPRDIAEVGGKLLFGYNVYLGLKRETKIEDVFALHTFEETKSGSFAFDHAEAEFLQDPKFIKDFNELYKYYKETKLIQLRKVAAKILAVFQIGATTRDIKVFQWAVYPGGKVSYIDNRGEREHVFPPSHDFEWTISSREDHVAGRHPHVSILDEVFVETVGGDLTIKVEDNTDDGLGIYREPVTDPDQSLDDAQIHYAKVGPLILLKILPYREEKWRYLVFNTRTQAVDRIDAIGLSCVQLPEDHGLIFPGGYYLRSGETKVFAAEVEDLEFIRKLASPNGEDVLYVFLQREGGENIILPYNMIRKEVQNPIYCNGYSIFDDGKMVIFRMQADEATRVHPMQIWQTPFTSDEFAAKAPSTGSYLENVGNADLVRGISDSLSLQRMITEQQPTVQIYEDLILATTRAIDTYYWLDHKEVGDLRATLREVRATAELIIGEFEKVEVIRAQAVEAVAEAETRLTEVLRTLHPDRWTSVDQFVTALTELRRQRGQLITLRDLRYVDLEAIQAIEDRVVKEFDGISAFTVDFLNSDQALVPYHHKIDQIEALFEKVEKVTEAEPLREQLGEIDEGLQLLNEVVAGLDIDDSTVRTGILEGISGVLGSLNRARALLENRRKELRSTEAVAEFGAQFKVFGQSVTAALSMSDTPEKCEAELSRMMLGLEELEGRFSDFDEFLEQLATKREEVYEAFSAKKQLLSDQRQRRAEHMMQAATRILDSIGRRTKKLASVDEINSYFAADTMVAKVRDLALKLRELGDTVKADEVESRLKSARQEAARSQKDRQDIYEEGAEVIKLGRHRFSVNTQALDLTMVPREHLMFLHLSGTDYYEQINDEGFAATHEFWDQEMVSETADVYRCEYLAYCILTDAEEETNGLSLRRLIEAVAGDMDLLELVREYTTSRYDEGYERGLHDADGALILSKLFGLYSTADLLRFAPSPRAYACLFWSYFLDQVLRDQWRRRAQSLTRLRQAYAHSPAIINFTNELEEAIRTFLENSGINADAHDLRNAASYLFEELGEDQISFVTSAEAVKLKQAFLTHVKEVGNLSAFEEDMRQLQDDLTNRWQLASAWVSGFLASTEDAEVLANRHAAVEATALLLTETSISRNISSALTSATIEGLLGQHPRIDNRCLELRLDEFLHRVGSFRHRRVPEYRAFQEQRHALLERERARLRLSEYKPRVLSSFVRNKLINDVYLPLIGDNLAKQIGALGDEKRTDLMGMLLLISPPGYGKTTLMEYMANRLGLIFMKINGPALGHSVTSLDPGEAPNATARQEVEKINLSFEMGNNVLLYVDDIQHTSSEFLQKFISLCDAQRRVEGVWNGITRTYDLRGKRFAVCMAGNPYTESGERFQIPDMLANRADTYNLGDILEGRDEVFALSYLENALTSNPILAPLTTRDQDDVYKLVKIARGEPLQADQLSHPYSSVELNEIVEVLKRLVRVQEVLLAVNQQYIYSASQDEAYRTEPRFQLQGSYRNMNKLAEKVVSVMNDAELEALIEDHYIGEAQTLTTGAEHNMLKLAELRGVMTDEQKERWAQIKRGFARVQAMGGDEDDPVARVTGTLGLVSDRLGEIGQQIGLAKQAAAEAPEGLDLAETLAPVLEKLGESMASLSAQRAAKPAKQPAAQPLVDPAVFDAMADRLGKLGEGLDAIGQAIMASAAASAKAPARKKGPEPPPVPSVDLSPYLERLDQTVAAFAATSAAAGAHGGGMQVVQTLQPGVHDLLEEMTVNIETGLLELIRTLSRKIKRTDKSEDKHLRAMMNRMTKNFDMLKDLVQALRKLDTAGYVPSSDEKEPAPEKPKPKARPKK